MPLVAIKKKMIAFINGILIEKNENEVVIDVSGIGYSVGVSTNTVSSLPSEGNTVKVFTYTHVREDEISLFGFLSLEEKKLFLKLIEVNGVGPKSAMGIMSGISVGELLNAIVSEDYGMLQKIKGLGRKTAERIVLELKDKVSPTEAIVMSVDVNTSALNEAIEVLVSLGISKNQALISARQFASKSETAEEIVQNVLQNMGR